MNEETRNLLTLGREYYQAGAYDKAEPCLVRVVDSHPTFADIFNMLGVIYHSQGRFSEAESHFEHALKLNPRYTDAALNLSVTYNDRGKYEEARTVYTNALQSTGENRRQLDPYARGKIANMHADLGATYAAAGFEREAIAEYQKALTLCPDFVDIRTRLGNLYREIGDFPAAVAEFEVAVRTRADYMPAQIALGIAHYSMGQHGRAVAQWQHVLARDPSNRNAALYLRMVANKARDIC